MDAALALQQRIHASIPLSAAMQFSIVQLSRESILVTAPLAPNVNIHGTGFAGSIYSLAVLSGWALCSHGIELLGLDGELVVTKGEMRNRSPVRGEIRCRTSISPLQYEKLEKDFYRNGKARLSLQIDVGEDRNAVLQASYAVIAAEEPGRSSS